MNIETTELSSKMYKEQTVALLISTYNWPQALELSLLSILKQTKMPDEIVIADDGSGEETKALIERYRSKSGVIIKHVWHEDKGFRKSMILNKAVKQITSDYIIEIDGDMIVHPKFVHDHLNAAQEGYFAQGSRVMINKPKSKNILETKQINLSVLTKGLSNRLNAVYSPVLSYIFQLIPSDPFHIKGCNLAFWKKDFIVINGYYNGFEGWGAEDYEFGARLLHAGIKRKRLKMVALGFHIFHSDNSRSNTGANDNIYRKTRSDKTTFTSDGYLQV